MKLMPIEWRFEGSCIRCTSHHHRHGYPVTHRNGKQTKIVQQIALRKYPEMRSGMVTRHTCDNPWCINPNHIIPGSQSDNLADMRSRGRHAFGEKHGRSKLTKADVFEILAASGTQREIALAYGVGQPTVSRIKNGKKWGDVFK